MLFNKFFRGKKAATAGKQENPIGYDKPEAHERPVAEVKTTLEAVSVPQAVSEPVKDEDIITVHNLLILDESGSMSSIYNAALTGANETIQTIRAAQQQYSNQNHRFTFVTFNTVGVTTHDIQENIKTIIDDSPILEVRDLTRRDYNPAACTPLYDAMGRSINHLRRRVKEGDRALVTVITDGLENASQEYSGRMIKNLVTELREQGWTFVYIGANQDAVEVAKDLNINNSLNFAATDAGAFDMYQMHREKSRKYYRKMSSFGRGYSSEEDFFDSRKEQRITPRYIDELEPNEVFVFLSDVRGEHRHGSAELAYQRFGAIWGQASGPQGHCYAIPSMANADGYRPYVNEFLEYARQHPDQLFLVYDFPFDPVVMMPLFEDAATITNICLPKAFWDLYYRRHHR